MASESFNLTKNPFLAWAQNAGAYNIKLMEFADVVTNHVRDQFESLTEQVEEFSALAQKATSKDEDEAQPGWGE